MRLLVIRQYSNGEKQELFGLVPLSQERVEQNVVKPKRLIEFWQIWEADHWYRNFQLFFYFFHMNENIGERCANNNRELWWEERKKSVLSGNYFLF